MGTWIGVARTNYFRTKDGEALRAWAQHSGLAIADRLDEARSRRYAILAADGWPTTVKTEDEHGWRDFDLIGELAVHVVAGEIVVCLEAGSEKLRYVTGEAIAFRTMFGKIERLTLSLEDIYVLAFERWGSPQPGRAEY